jgi:hypothetical protein
MAIPRQTGFTSRVGISSDRADKIAGTIIAIARAGAKQLRIFVKPFDLLGRLGRICNGLAEFSARPDKITLI